MRHRYAIDVACLLIAATVAIATVAASQERVKERLRVAESAVLVRPPTRHVLGLPIRRPPTPRELTVFLGEEPLEVTQVQKLGSEETWTVVIYLDAPLTAGETLSRSALALARVAETLTAFGPVELLVASSTGVESKVPPTRTAWSLQSALADATRQADNGELGGQLAAMRRARLIARHGRERSGSDGASAFGALVEQQDDRLLVALRDRRCRTDLCLLLLVREGYPEGEEAPAVDAEADVPAARSDAPTAPGDADESRRLARELAAARWLVGVVVTQEAADPDDTPSVRPPEARQLDAGIPPGQSPGHAALYPSGYSQDLEIEQLDLLLRLDSAPLKHIARETGGFLAATPQGLAEDLQTVRERLLVWFRQPASPPDGVVPLRVVFEPRSQDLWAPRWWRFHDESR